MVNDRVPRIPGFEIVLRSEHVLPAGLTLPTGHRPQRIETSGDRRNEALLGLHVGRDRSIARRLLLVGAVAAPEPLRSEEHTSELQSLMRISYAVLCLKKNKKQ